MTIRHFSASARPLTAAWSNAHIFFDDSRFYFDSPGKPPMSRGLGIGANLNRPSWSIGTDFAAYLLFPLPAWPMFGGWRGSAR